MGSTLSPFLFALVLGRLTDEVRQEISRNVMFADKNREQVKENFGRWWFAFEKIECRSAECIFMMWMKSGSMVKLEAAEEAKDAEFKYLVSAIQKRV